MILKIHFYWFYKSRWCPLTWRSKRHRYMTFLIVWYWFFNGLLIERSPQIYKRGTLLCKDAQHSWFAVLWQFICVLDDSNFNEFFFVEELNFSPEKIWTVQMRINSPDAAQQGYCALLHNRVLRSQIYLILLFLQDFSKKIAYS